MQILLSVEMYELMVNGALSQTGMMKEMLSSLYVADVLMCAFMYEWICVSVRILFSSTFRAIPLGADIWSKFISEMD